ncbi:KAP family NTPase [Pseudomonas sp. B21-032]|uniref:KAP family P-loop NTPase fold protein n=1 Tax=Pseudomonas sp. B21-032 TaxID=2895483 RepID=UPI00215F4FDD|nr:KAP family NTPase [Pseudomonas sp. B21-032]UVL59416.1 KAP family NTPase [Pseudomonas sp. B21-032]
MPTHEVQGAVEGHDRAAQQREDDLLDRWSIARSVLRAASATPAWSTRIALCGRWGSGKTSVLNFIERQAGQENRRRCQADRQWVIVRFSAWNATEQGGIGSFYQALLGQLGKQQIKVPRLARWAKNAAAKLGGMADVVKVVIDAGVKLLPGAEVTTAAVGGVHKLLARLPKWLQPGAEDLRALQAELHSVQVLVFIDDLDRIDPKLIPSVLMSLKELLDWPRFVFVLAFDLEVVSKALKDHSQAFGPDAQRFLEKIIDIRFHLPEPEAEQAASLAWSLYEQNLAFIPRPAYARVVDCMPGNPRLAKAIVRELCLYREVAGRHASHELRWEVIVLQTILRHEAPATERALARALQSAESGLKAKKDSFVAESIKADEVGFEALQRKVQEFLLLCERVPATLLAKQAKLLISEPVFTDKEYQDFLRRWNAQEEAEQVSAFIRQCVDIAFKRPGDVAREFLEKVLADYGDASRKMVDQHSEGLRRSSTDAAHKQLSLLETSWRMSDPAIQESCQSLDAFTRLWGNTLLSRMSFMSASAPRDFVQREEQLLERALEGCRSKIELFEWMQAMLYRHSLEKRTSQRQLQFIDKLARSLDSEVIDSTLQAFIQARGVARAQAQSGNPHGSLYWRLTSEDSPLYTPAGCRRLCQLFEDVPSAVTARADFTENVVDYLVMLASRIMPTQKMETYTAQQVRQMQDIAATAWRTLLSTAQDYKDPGRLMDNHKYLSSYLDSALIPVPEWLSQWHERTRMSRVEN